MARGALFASKGWTVETAELMCVPPKARGNGILGQAQPDSGGAWLLVKSPGRVFWVRTVEEAQKIVGPDWAGLTKIREW